MSPGPIDRRKALTMFGAAGVGAVVLGACGSSGNGDGAQPATTSGAGPTSTNGSAAGSGTTLAPAAGGTLSAASFANASSCTLTPEQTEGPYYIDVDKIRSDIREDRPGVPLRLGARVMSSDGCTPVKDAVFEIWHCDAGGVYSGFEQASLGAGGGGAPRQGGGGGGASQTDTTRYLRGGQVTNADGIAELTTIYPGWYQGRTVHVHAKVHLSNREVLTTQLYFDDAVSDKVLANAPYSAKTGRRTLNSEDGIYRKETTLTVTPEGDDYLGLITIGISG